MVKEENQRLIKMTNFDDDSQCCGPRVYTLNVYLLGVSFCVLFTAYNTTQNLETSVNAKLGYYSLGIIYIFFAASTFIASALVSRLGEKTALIISSATYAFFVAANIHVIPALLLASSALLGLGASVLWTAQGAFLVRNSLSQDLGKNSGIFFGIFQTNQLIGNLLAAYLFHTGNSPSFVFIILACIGGLAVFSFLLLRNVEPIEGTTKLTSVRLSDTFKLLRKWQMLSLVPIMMYSGLSQTFFGIFPQAVKETLNIEIVCYVMACFGAGDAIGSVLLGRISDTVGRRPIIVFSSLCIIGSFFLTYQATYVLSHKFLIFIAAGVLAGISDSGFNTQIYSILGNLFPEPEGVAFAIFKLFQSLMTGAAFLYGSYITLVQNMLIILGSLILGLIFFFVLYFLVPNLEDKKENRINVID